MLDPLVPAIRPRDPHDVVAGGIDAVHLDSLAGLDRDLASSGRHGRAAAADGNARVAVGIHVDPVVAGALEAHGRVGRIHLEGLVIRKVTDLERGHAGVDRELLRVFGQVEGPQIGAGPEADDVAAVHLQLDTAAPARVDPVAQGHRDVAVGGLPVVGVVPAQERHVAGNVGDPSDRLVDLSILVALLRAGRGDKEQGTEEAPKRPEISRPGHAFHSRSSVLRMPSVQLPFPPRAPEKGAGACILGGIAPGLVPSRGPSVLGRGRAP